MILHQSVGDDSRSIGSTISAGVCIIRFGFVYTFLRGGFKFRVGVGPKDICENVRKSCYTIGDGSRTSLQYSAINDFVLILSIGVIYFIIFIRGITCIILPFITYAFSFWIWELSSRWVDGVVICVEEAAGAPPGAPPASSIPGIDGGGADAP